MKITAAVVREKYAPVRLEELTIDEPRDDEILVRMVAAGICRTDVSMRDQKRPVPQPIVLGHEGAGIVERTGKAVRSVRPGDHVVMSYDYCGGCRSCIGGHPAYCDHSFAYNFAGSRPDKSVPFRCEEKPVHGSFFGQSSFATFALCNERNAVVIPQEAPLEVAAVLGCGVQTGASAIFKTLKVAPGEAVLIVGTGSVGLAAVMAAKIAGATAIIAMDNNPYRLPLAKELGATHTFDTTVSGIADAVHNVDQRGVDVAFDTTGNPALMADAFFALAPVGRLGVCAIGGSELPIPLLNMVDRGKSVHGIVQGDAISKPLIPTLVELHRQGRFPVDRLITYFPFLQINTAIAEMTDGRVVKPVLRF